MKEADIVFGRLYAVDFGDGPECWEVVKKFPPKPGASRSRMYMVRTSAAENQIDASKILMPWSEYEQTPEYAKQHYAVVEEALERQIRGEIQQWWEVTRTYLRTMLTVEGEEPFLPAMLSMPRLPKDDFAFIKRTLKTVSISMPLGSLLSLLGDEMALPSMDAIKETLEHREEVLLQLRVRQLPDLAEEIREIFDEINSNSNRYGFFPTHKMQLYIETLIDADIPGPHDLVCEAARTDPNWDYLKELTARPQFAYLIPYLHFT